MYMRINDVINSKGHTVVTARTDQTVARLIELLAGHRIGAVVVTDDGESVAGIAGERDVVRVLAERGLSAMEVPIGEIMETRVHACSPDQDLATVAGIMTEYRCRHMPVMSDDRFIAIVSIGDIVKGRIDQLQTEQEYLLHYVHGD